MRDAVASRTRITRQIKDLERRIDKQIRALEAEVEPQLVGRRIAELRREKEKRETALADLGETVEEASMDEVGDLLRRMPNLSKEL
jgi:hypothetical protein